MNNNLYNNEILCCYVFESIFKKVEKLDISKVVLILPICLDSSVMKKLKQFKKDKNLIDYVSTNPRIFSNQKKLYYEYLHLSMNTIQLCIEYGMLILKGNDLFFNNENTLFSNFKANDNKLVENITENIDRVCNFLKNEESYELYYALRIEV